MMLISSISLFIYLSYLTTASQKEIKGLTKVRAYRKLPANMETADYSEEYALVEAV